MSAPAGNTPPACEVLYQATHIASCPDCLADCEDAGPRDFWCPACRKYWSPACVGWMEDDYDHDD